MIHDDRTKEQTKKGNEVIEKKDKVKEIVDDTGKDTDKRTERRSKRRPDQELGKNKSQTTAGRIKVGVKLRERKMEEG